MVVQIESPQQLEQRVVRHVDTGSVVRVLLALSATLAAVLVVGSIALYLLGAASGALGGLEGFIASLGWADFQFRFFSVLPIALLLGLLMSLVITVAGTVLAVLYNALADLVGGVEVSVRPR